MAYQNGQPIPGCRVVPVKTPLGQDFDNEVPEHARLTPELLINALRLKHGIEIGLILDLSNSPAKYCIDEDLQTKYDLKYMKLQCVAKVIPSEEEVLLAIQIIEDFLRERPDKYVAVHCQYGCNRTGFMVCNYLMHKNPQLSVEQALGMFEQAKPPGQCL